MISNGPCEPVLIDLERDLPTTPDDVRALREGRADVVSWLGLTAGEIDAILPEDAPLRPPPGPEPFSLD